MFSVLGGCGIDVGATNGRASAEGPLDGKAGMFAHTMNTEGRCAPVSVLVRFALLVSAIVMVASPVASAVEIDDESDQIAVLTEAAFRDASARLIDRYVESGLDEQTASQLVLRVFEGTSRCLVDAVMANLGASAEAKQELLSGIQEKLSNGDSIYVVLNTLPLDDSVMTITTAPCFLAVAQEAGIAIGEEAGR